MAGNHRGAAVAALLALTTLPAAAAVPSCAASEEQFDLATVSVARVRAPVAHFYREEAGCPQLRCQAKARVVIGDEVVVTATATGWSCATFVGAKGQASHGWLRDVDIEPVAAPASTLEDWVGAWHFSDSRDDDEDIRIAPGRTPGHLTVTGTESRLRMGTSWIGGDIVPKDGGGGCAEGKQGEPGGVEVKPTSFLTFTSFARDHRLGERRCRVALRRLGRYLVVDDNEQCGAYQTYRGVYGRFDARSADELSR